MEPEVTQKSTGKLGFRFSIGTALFLLIIICYSLVIYYIRHQTNLSVSYLYIMGAMLVATSAFIILGLRWKIHTSIYNPAIELFSLIKMEAIAKFVNKLSPFQLNIPFRCVFLKKYHIDMSKSMGLSIFELAFETVFCCAGILICGYILHRNYVSVLLLPLFLFALYFLFSKTFADFVNKISQRVESRFLKKICQILVDLPAAISIYFDFPKKIMLLFFSTSLIYGIRTTRTFLVFRSLEVQVPFLVILLVNFLVPLLMFLVRIPGGIGVYESTGTLVYRSFVGTKVALAGVLIDRLIIFLWIILLGGGLLLAEVARKENRVFYRQIFTSYKSI